MIGRIRQTLAELHIAAGINPPTGALVLNPFTFRPLSNM